MSMERNHLWKVLPSFIFSLNQMRSTGYVVSGYIYILLETHGFNTFRLNKQSERSRGCLSRHLRLRCRQKCVILPVPWADIAFSSLLHDDNEFDNGTEISLKRIIMITTFNIHYTFQWVCNVYATFTIHHFIAAVCMTDHPTELLGRWALAFPCNYECQV